MLKETETEETIGFFVTFLSLVTFQLRGRGSGPPAPRATPMVSDQLVEVSLSRFAINFSWILQKFGKNFRKLH